VPRPLSTVGSAVLVQDNAFAALQKHHIHELLNSVTRSPDGRVAVNRFAVDRVWLVRNTRLWKLYTLHREHVATVAHTSQLHDAGGRKPSIATAQNTWVQNTLDLRTDVNEHLLFHGCRSVNRAKIIIEQGFDERIANLSGFLGKRFANLILCNQRTYNSSRCCTAMRSWLHYAYVTMIMCSSI
jgi:hypothetical protein